MKVYFLVFLITLCLQFISADTDRKYLRKLIFSFMPLFLFGALRVDFGYDYANYELGYMLYNSYGIDLLAHSEIGYQILNIIMPSFRSLIVLQSALVCAAYISFFYRYVPRDITWLAFILLFLTGQYTVFFMFSAMRNAIAISIMILSSPLVENRKLLPYAMLVFLATTFHTSAIIIMPTVYFVCRNSLMSKREIMIWLVLMAVLIIIPMNYLLNFASVFFDTYIDRYSSYIDNAEEYVDRSLLIMSTATILGLGALLFSKNSEDTIDSFIVRMALLCIYAYYLGSLNMRIENYLKFFFVGYMTRFMHFKFKNNLFQYGYFAFVLLYLGYAFIKVFINSPSFPYEHYYSIFSL